MTNKFVIDPSNYRIIKKINSGGFGQVYTVQNTESKEVCAAKVVNSSGSQSRTMINREIGVMMRMQHPTIIKFYGYSLIDFEGNENTVMFMQYAPNGTLADILNDVRQGLADHSYDNTIRQKILIGISRGMMYLHQHHVMHRDLKPENILIDENFEPHITDFGLSKFYNTGQTNDHTQTIGTSIYISPETIEGGNYNYKADVYSFGILMYEIVTDLVPYPDLENRKISFLQLSRKILNEDYRPSFDEHPIKESIQELIEKCWSRDPNTRPTFEEIFNRLAYNIEESVDDIFQTGEEGKYYLEGVDVNEVLFYADEISDDKGNFASNSSSIDDLKKLITNLVNKNERWANDFKKVLEENAQMKQKISQLEKESEESTKNINLLLTQNEQSVNDIQRLSDENNQMKQQISKLEKENEDSAKSIKKLQSDKKKMKQKISNLQKQDATKDQPEKSESKLSERSSDNILTENSSFAQSNKPQLGYIKIHVFGGKKLKKMDTIGNSDPYMTFEIKGDSDSKVKTSVVPNNLNPEWNEDLILEVPDIKNNCFLINLWDQDISKDDRMMNEMEISTVTIPIGKKQIFNDTIYLKKKEAGSIHFEYELFTGSKPINLLDSFRVKKERRTRSSEKFQIIKNIENSPLLISSKPQKGYLKIHVVDGRKLKKMDAIGKSDPYMTFEVKGYTNSKVKTRVISNNLNPEWNEDLILEIPDIKTNCVLINLWDEDIKNDDRMMNEMEMATATIPIGQKQTFNEAIYLKKKEAGVIHFDFQLFTGSKPK
ncbi:hypothetical protein M9Y10_044289 [Tritrichomonas musculus]|uniref:Uncharacterized protein n=1 Tax=Tritrichomonas musculus TaxID=1915356 RepID=A0ABR2K216_9EUKA